MKSNVDFIMITQLNQILKEKHIEYTLHAIGGCSCCGLELRRAGKEVNADVILNIVNDYLASKWLVASYQLDDKTMLYVDSKFNNR